MSPPTTETPTTEQVQEKAKEGVEAARDQAQSAAGQVREQARTQVDDRTTMVGDQLKTHAGDARSVAEQLRNDGKDGPARLVEEAADRADSAGRYLSEADAERLLRDVEDFARSNPMAVIAGGLALGFAASRLLSASSSTRSRALASGSGSSTGRSAPVPATPAPAQIASGSQDRQDDTPPIAAPGPSTPAYATPPATGLS